MGEGGRIISQGGGFLAGSRKKVCPPVLSALLSPEVVADHLKMLPVVEQRGDGKLDTPAKLSRRLHLRLPPTEATTATTSCVSAESETSLLCEGDEREKTSQSEGREGEGGFDERKGGSKQ